MTYAVKSTGQFIRRHLIKGPVQFRERLQRTGPIFIKIGQYLALRPDILPQEYCDELMLLFEQVEPFPWNEAKAILKKELGRDPSEIFDFINPRPEAAGSLAQVHIARLQDGTDVAVKIQRPNIRERVLKDLRRAELIARLMEVGGGFRTFSPRAVVREIKAWMLQEIDFTVELSNLTQMYQNMKGSPIEKAPQPYPAYCTSKVLTAEYLRGISFSELLTALRSGSVNDLVRIRKSDINWNQLATNLFQSCLTQVFSYQFFHADLHPGNLIALKGNKVGFVDFGLCDKLDETVRGKQLQYLTAVYSRNVEAMFKAMTEILVVDDQTDMEAFRRDFFSETGSLFKKSRGATEDVRAAGAEEDNRPLGRYMISVMQSARRNKLQVPTEVLSMYRALLTAETVAKQLDPDADLGAIGRRFFTKIQTEDLLRSCDHDSLQVNAFNLLTLFRDSPGQLQQILREISEGKYMLNVSVTEVPKVVRSQNRRTKVLVHAILTIGITILLSAFRLPVVFGIHLSWVLSGILFLFYISIYIQLKRL